MKKLLLGLPWVWLHSPRAKRRPKTSITWPRCAGLPLGAVRFRPGDDKTKGAITVPSLVLLAGCIPLGRGKNGQLCVKSETLQVSVNTAACP